MTTQRGNAFLYVLIAIALFAGLTFVLSRGQTGGEKGQLTEAQLKTNTERLLAYVNQTTQVWVQMMQTGTSLDELDLVLPTDSVLFNAAPHTHKLFHPAGGGLLYNAMTTPDFQAGISTATPGWHIVKVNADWTETGGTDLVMTYVDIRQDLCTELNEKITGSATIPVVTVNFENTFVDATAPLLETECAQCKTYPTICIGNGDGYAFYNLIEKR